MGPQSTYPSSYFKDVDSNPKILKAILIDFLRKIGYSLFNVSFANRIYIGDYSNNEYSIVKAIDQMKNINLFPFIIYVIENTSLDEDNTILWNRNLSSGIYSNFLNRYVYIWPEYSEISLYFFLSTPDDFYVCSNYFHLYKFYPIREYFEYYLNFNTSKYYNKDIVYKAIFPYTIMIFSIEKGDYAFKFREYLEKSKIFDLVIKLKLHYHNLMLTQYEDVNIIERIQLNDNMILIEDNNTIFQIVQYNKIDNSIYIEFSKSIDFKNFQYIISKGNFKGTINFENNYKIVRFIGDFELPLYLVIPKTNNSLQSKIFHYNENLDKDYELRFMV